MASSDSHPLPQKNVAYRVYFPVSKNDGTIITGWTGAAATLSKDGATSVSATNTPTEIATSWGIGYLDLVAGEMNTNNTSIKVTVTNAGALPTVLSLYPQANGLDIPVDTEYWKGGLIPAVNVTGTPKVDIVDILGTASAGAAGYVGTDQSKITNATSTVDLSGTTIKNVDNAIANVTTVATTTNLTNAPTSGDFTATMKTSLNAATPASVTGNVGGNVVGSVASVTAPVTVGTNNDKTGYSLVTPPLTSAQTAAAVLDVSGAAHDTPGTIGALINASGSAGDPLLNPVPGSYAAGTAGYDIGLLPGINARTNATTISVQSPNAGSGNLTLVRYQTYAAAIGTQIQVACAVPTDPTVSGSVVTFTFVFGIQPNYFTGSVVSYDPSAGSAVFGLELSYTDTGAFPTAQNAKFALSVKLPGSSGNLVEVSYSQGELTVLDAPAVQP